MLSVDILTDKPRIMVVNADKSTTVWEHFIAEFVDDKVLWEYIDSFDREPEGAFKHVMDGIEELEHLVVDSYRV